MSSADPPTATRTYRNGVVAPDRFREVRGALSGTTFRVPDVDSGYPVARLIGADGEALEEFPRGDGRPDTRSPRLKLGVLIPAANATVESELWDVVFRNREALTGVGLHTSLIVSQASPRFANAGELEAYRRAFHASLDATLDAVLQAEPQYLIMGFSLEHFSPRLEDSEEPVRRLEQRSGLGMASWSRAVDAALRRFEARRIGLLCPFDPKGLANAMGFFTALGYEVATAAGLGCASGIDVAHIPDDYKEKVIRERLLARPVDAIVQCGTNLSGLDLAERLEPEIGVPILGINATTLWYALRENGIAAPLEGCSRLLREF